jgi:hypothetical protein
VQQTFYNAELLPVLLAIKNFEFGGKIIVVVWLNGLVDGRKWWMGINK